MLLTSRLLALWAPGDFGEATTLSVLVDLKYTSKLLFSYAQAELHPTVLASEKQHLNVHACKMRAIWRIYMQKHVHFARAKSDMNCHTSLNDTQFGCI